MAERYEVEERIRTLRSFYANMEIDRYSKKPLGRYAITDLGEQVSRINADLESLLQLKNLLSVLMLDGFCEALSSYQRALASILSADDSEFISQNLEFRRELETAWDQTRLAWTGIAGLAAQEAIRAINSPENNAQLNQAKEAAVKQIVEEGSRQIEHTLKAGKQTVEEIQRASQGVSIRSAQDQFNAAAQSLWRKTCYWIGFCTLAFIAFFWYAYWVSAHPPKSMQMHNSNYVEVVYFGLIRLTILTALGALINFALKMVRAHLHMSEVNEHRKRVANSMKSFVNSAHTPENRDLIFARLVDSIVEFGDSGLLTKDTEGPTVSTNLIEAISRSIGTK